MAKRTGKSSVEQAVKKLGEVTFTGYPLEEGYAIWATASFGGPTFEWGEYVVQLGLTHAALAIDHPAYDSTDYYEAFLSSKDWSENAKESTNTEKKGGFLVKLGLKAGPAAAEVHGGVSGSNSKSTETKAAASFPLVTRQPGRWLIATTAGDPRRPATGALGRCLSGLYLDGDRGADTTAIKKTIGGKERSMLCVLTPKAGANDASVRAMLIGPVAALQLSVNRKEMTGVSLATEAIGKRNQEDQLRIVIAEICLEKAKSASQDQRSLHKEHVLDGELLLAQAERLLNPPPAAPISSIKPSPAKKMSKQ